MDKSAGKPVVMLYTDDTSGNRSKKWHLFNSWSVLLAGIPRKQNSQLSKIHFLSCSDSVSVLDMAEPIAEELLDDNFPTVVQVRGALERPLSHTNYPGIL
jgi:hypothetical protein